MKRFVSIALALLLNATPGLAQGTTNKSFEAAIPPDSSVRFNVALYGRALSAMMPAGFLPQPPQRAPKQYMLEFLLRGETFDNWTQLVTVTSFDGIGGAPLTSVDIARRFFGSSPCAGKQTFDAGEETVGEDGLKQLVVALSCDDLPAGAYPGAVAGASERAAIYIFRDERALHTVQYAERSKSKSKNPPASAAKAAEILKAKFGDVRLVRQP